LIDGRFFPNCKPENLPWAARRNALLENIEALNADIVCLQEVEHFEGFWRPALRALGYRGVYKQRGAGSKPDGCATFYREARFALIEHRSIDFDHVSGCRLGADRVGPGFATQNVALLTLLAPLFLSSGLNAVSRLAVANVHLFWDPGYEDLKLAQARAAVEAAEQLATDAEGSCHVPAAIILAGDFNAMPQSDVYAYLAGEARFTSAYAAVALSSSSTATATTALAEGPYGSGYAPETSGSAASVSASAAAEPAFTNFRDCFRGAIDYVFLRDAAYGGPRLRATAALGMMGEEEAAAEGGGLPSSRHPSDHLPLAADLSLLPASEPPPERPAGAAAAEPPPSTAAGIVAVEAVKTPSFAGPTEEAEAGPRPRARRRKRAGGGGRGGG
jgi:CCR4-NOT transcription complex subunit 6